MRTRVSVSELLLGVFLWCAAVLAAEAEPESFRVGVYHARGESSGGWRAVVGSLQKAGYKAETFEFVTPDALAKYDAVVFPACFAILSHYDKYDDLFDRDWEDTVWDYVVNKGGCALFQHRSCGNPFYGLVSVSLFPTVCRGIQEKESDPYTVPAIKHPVTVGLEVGAPYPQMYFDHFLLRDGPAGVVVARSRRGVPVIVIGQAGRGRVAYWGSVLLDPKEGEVERARGAEERLLANLMDWFAEGKRSKASVGKEPRRRALASNSVALPEGVSLTRDNLVGHGRLDLRRAYIYPEPEMLTDRRDVLPLAGEGKTLAMLLLSGPKHSDLDEAASTLNEKVKAISGLSLPIRRLVRDGPPRLAIGSPGDGPRVLRSTFHAHTYGFRWLASQKGQGRVVVYGSSPTELLAAASQLRHLVCQRGTAAVLLAADSSDRLVRHADFRPGGERPFPSASLPRALANALPQRPQTFHFFGYFVNYGTTASEIADYCVRNHVDVAVLPAVTDMRMVEMCGFKHSGDPLAELVTEMHRRGVKVFLDGGAIPDSSAQEQLGGQYPMVARDGKKSWVCRNRPEVQAVGFQQWKKLVARYQPDGVTHEDDFGITPCCCDFCRDDFQQFCGKEWLAYVLPEKIAPESVGPEAKAWLLYKHACAVRYSQGFVSAIKSAKSVPVGVWLNEVEYRSRRGLSLEDAAGLFDIIGIMSYESGWKFTYYGALRAIQAARGKAQVWVIGELQTAPQPAERSASVGRRLEAPIYCGAEATGIFPWGTGYWYKNLDPVCFEVAQRTVVETFRDIGRVWLAHWRGSLALLGEVAVTEPYFRSAQWVELNNDFVSTLVPPLEELGLGVKVIPWYAEWHPLERQQLSRATVGDAKALLILEGYGDGIGTSQADLAFLREYVHQGHGVLVQGRGLLCDEEGKERPASEVTDLLAGQASGRFARMAHLSLRLEAGGTVKCGDSLPAIRLTRGAFPMITDGTSTLVAGRQGGRGRLLYVADSVLPSAPDGWPPLLARAIQWLAGLEGVRISDRKTGPSSCSFTLTNRGKTTYRGPVAIAVPRGVASPRVEANGQQALVVKRSVRGTLEYLWINVTVMAGASVVVSAEWRPYPGANREPK